MGKLLQKRKANGGILQLCKYNIVNMESCTVDPHYLLEPFWANGVQIGKWKVQIA